ncbi:hypothetical protein PFLUV_G00065810 [Perca fluviatilis]|uniref:Hexosyltransferase n=2 Tax=Perca fluviatilis TaxID=8168 RepID=A0A6A5FFS5_PERFL|nr:hypothetical protein PFLUV_G00065810 [Perca fluviatilis]
MELTTAVFGTCPFPGLPCWERPLPSRRIFLLDYREGGVIGLGVPVAMRRACLWTLVKCLSVSGLLVLSAHIFTVRRKDPATPSPLPAAEYRLLSPDTYGYTLTPAAVFRDTPPFLLLLVPVSPGEAAARDAIRQTWGAPGRDSRALFFVGLPEGGRGSSVQAQLEEESRTHADIVQMDFQDSYHNLTIKTLMMMNWLASHCPHASYAMKVDADIFVNVFLLLRRLRSSPRRGFISGSVISDGRPRRDSNSKWRVSEELYPADSFPPYLSGAGYVFSADMAARISWASRFVRMLPLEDVYVGLCLRVLAVQPVYSRSLLPPRNLFEIRHLDYDRCTFAKLIIVNGFTPSQLLHMWQDFSSGHSSC